jgi:transposase
MAFKPTRMNQIKVLIRDLLAGVPIKRASRVHGLSRNTVKKYLAIYNSSGIDASELEGMCDEEFNRHFYEHPSATTPETLRAEDFKERIPHILNELGRIGVTRELIWNEYIQASPQGYSYSRFCRKLKEHRLINESTIRIDHKAAHRMMVDFAGSKAQWVDPRTGEVHRCEVLVSTLPYSSFTHAYAVPSQKQADFVTAINEALRYIGGTPTVLTSDNLKSYVSKADRYEPKFTDFCSQMGSWYTMELDATRAGKPKDKANVERHVSIVYNQIYAPLRDQVFHSIEELNAAFRCQLDILNDKKMQGKTYSRRERYESEEKAYLRPLPSTMFEVNKSTMAKVQRNYHVILGENNHYYSVPYQYIGKQTQLIYTAHTVEIYSGTDRIATHKRDYRTHAYSTFPAHMPEKHVKYLEQKGWDADYFNKKAAQIGPSTLWAIQTILASKQIVEQAYRACVGTLMLAEKYSPERLENAAKRAALGHRATYTILQNILSNNMDKLEIPVQQSQQPTQIIPNHNNIRGPQYYSQATLPFIN